MVRMDASNRLRILLVGLVTLGVMGGVVAAARHGRAPEQGDEPSSLAVGRGSDGSRDGFPEGGRLPPECLPSTTEPARLRFDLPADRLDLGAVKQGATIEHDVIVRNAGSGTLCIPNKPVTGCGCVQAEWVGPTRIPPTGTGIVRLRIDTRGKEGHVDKDVTVTSNDPDRRDAIFHIQFEVKVGVMVARTKDVTGGTVVYFGRHAPGKPGTAVIRLKTPVGEPEWKVTDVRGTKTKFIWSVAPAELNDPNFHHVDVTVTHPGSEQLDLNDESLKISTTHPDRPEILLQSQLLVARKYYTSPNALRFGFLGGGARGAVATPRVVFVYPGEEGTKFVVERAEVVGDGFTAGVPVDKGADGWQIEVRYDERPRGKGPVDAKLVIHVADADLPTIEVPIHGEVRE